MKYLQGTLLLNEYSLKIQIESSKQKEMAAVNTIYLTRKFWIPIFYFIIFSIILLLSHERNDPAIFFVIGWVLMGKTSQAVYLFFCRGPQTIHPHLTENLLQNCKMVCNLHFNLIIIPDAAKPQQGPSHSCEIFRPGRGIHGKACPSKADGSVYQR